VAVQMLALALVIQQSMAVAEVDLFSYCIHCLQDADYVGRSVYGVAIHFASVVSQ
jgi:hypothetical protein